jgi:hypothetical protein
MKQPTKPTISPTMAHASGLLGVDIEIVKQAKADGCPGFLGAGRVDVGVLRQWLRRRRGPKKAKAPTTSSKTPLVLGMGASLRRLEAQEAEAFDRMRRSVGTPGEGPARKAWLQVAEALRKADIALEESRRDAGELLPRKVAEDALEFALAFAAIATKQIVLRLSPIIAKQEERVELYGLTQTALASVVHVAAGMASGDGELPDWATAAMHRGSSRGLIPDDLGEWRKLGELARAMADGSVDNLIASSRFAGVEEPA